MLRPLSGGATAALPLALLLLLLAAPSAVAQAPSYTLNDWMSVSQVESFVWSPNGAAIFYSSNAAESGTYEVFRIPSQGGQAVHIGRQPEGQRPEPMTGLQISADGRNLIFTTSRLFQSYDNIYLLPTSGGAPQAVTFNDGVIETGPSLSPDGRTLAYFSRTGAGTRILLQDMTRPESWPRFLLTGTTSGERFPLFSPDGQRIAFSRGGDIWVVDAAGGEPRRVIEAAFAGGNSSPVWSPDGTRIAFTSGGSGWSQVAVVDVGSGRVTSLTRSPRDHGDVSWSPDGRAIVLVRGVGLGMSQEVAVLPSDGSGGARVVSRGIGLRASPQYSPDGRWIAYIETTGNRTRDVWRVPAAGGEPEQITRSMGRVDPARLPVGEEVTYLAPDNVPIPTMLYRPAGFQANRRYPVLVRLHGHPGQWNHGFEVMDQFFLDRGYIVIKPNPRGSRGFGQGFHDLHIADYGGAEFEDIMAVIPYLRTLGYADMDRVVTEGGSGGGYMSFVIATEAPTAFRAQAIRAPVSDWSLMAIDRFGASGRAWTATREPRREREEFGGAEHEIPNEYRRRSPINFVEHVQVPQLLMHGLRDSAVLPRQSTVWVDRMRELGKGNLITYVEYPDDDHTLVRYKATVRDRLSRMERFYAQHLGAGTTANPR